jgi:hypothetical protein
MLEHQFAAGMDRKRKRRGKRVATYLAGPQSLVSNQLESLGKKPSHKVRATSSTRNWKLRGSVPKFLGALGPSVYVSLRSGRMLIKHCTLRLAFQL